MPQKIMCIVREGNKERLKEYDLIVGSTGYVSYISDLESIPLYTHDRDSMSFNLLDITRRRVAQQIRLGRIKYFPSEYALKAGRQHAIFQNTLPIVESIDFPSKRDIFTEQKEYHDNADKGYKFYVKEFVWLRESSPNKTINLSFKYLTIGSSNVAKTLVIADIKTAIETYMTATANAYVSAVTDDMTLGETGLMIDFVGATKIYILFEGNSLKVYDNELASARFLDAQADIQIMFEIDNLKVVIYEFA